MSKRIEGNRLGKFKYEDRLIKRTGICFTDTGYAWFKDIGGHGFIEKMVNDAYFKSHYIPN